MYQHKFNVKPDFPVFDILDAISGFLAHTFGPDGSTTILEDRNIRHVATKDGYTVMKSLYSDDDLERVILEFVKRISMRLVRTVGDGSTSAVIVANCIAQHLKTFIADHAGKITPGDMNRIVELISNNIQARIQADAQELNVNSKDDMKKLWDVCMISTNSNKLISDLVVEAYLNIGKFGILQIERGDKKESDITYKKGFELYRGYIDPMFANRTVQDRNFCELFNARILMIEGRLGGTDIETASQLITAAHSNGESLVIIANGFNPDFIDFIRQNVLKFKGNLPICLIEHGVGSKKGRLHFSDAATVFGAKAVQYLSNNENIQKIFCPKADGVIDPSAYMTYLGFAKRVVVDELNSKFFEGRGLNTPDYNTLKTDLETQIKELGESESKFDYDSEIGELKVRYGRLCSAVAILTIGGNSKAEIETTSFLAEDAALAARSALQLGVVVAGNMEIPKLILQSKESIISECTKDYTDHTDKEFVAELVEGIFRAYLEVFSIASSKNCEEILEHLKAGEIYNIRTKLYEKIQNTVVLNPARTDKEIIMAAMSVTSLIATSNQFIYTPKNYGVQTY